jgi:uncharacterized protein (UPF0305 family)
LFHYFLKNAVILVTDNNAEKTKAERKIIEVRTEQSRKNNYIHKRKKAKLINLTTEYMAELIQDTKPKGVFTKKAINVAYQNMISVL